MKGPIAFQNSEDVLDVRDTFTIVFPHEERNRSLLSVCTLNFWMFNFHMVLLTKLDNCNNQFVGMW